MVIASDASSGRKWFSASDKVPKTLWPLLRPGASTTAAKLLDGRLSTSPGTPVEVEADEWIEHRDAHRYKITEDSVLGYSGLVLTLLWWQDESQIAALRGDDDEPVDELTGELTFRKRW